MHVCGSIVANEPSGHMYANALFLHTHDVSQVSGSRYGFLFSSSHLNSQFVGHSHVPLCIVLGQWQLGSVGVGVGASVGSSEHVGVGAGVVLQGVGSGLQGAGVGSGWQGAGVFPPQGLW